MTDQEQQLAPSTPPPAETAPTDSTPGGPPQTPDQPMFPHPTMEGVTAGRTPSGRKAPPRK